jgi:Transglycosylase SLT domain
MMGRVIGRLWIRENGSPGTASGSRALMLRGVAGCSALVLLGIGAIAGFQQPPGGISDGAAAAAQAAAAAAARRDAAPFGQIILPDLLIVSPAGLTAQQLTSLSQISGVRNMIAFDGADIKAGGQAVSVIGVDPAQFRSWVPLQTASDQPFWTALSAGELVASQTAVKSLGLRAGASYRLTGAASRTLQFGASASLGIEGVDLLVNSQVSRELGLVHQVAALISAPGAGLATLMSKVKQVLGPSGRIVSLRQQALPETSPTSSQLPRTYLQLFRDSAADYCPGLSWTVLAAIGQIESADGTNNGPSGAGALGPMQFLPSTWAVWGIDAFGQTGTPDIMNPYDAVASAARMLCADGAASGGSGLSGAIFDYNHATWYVSEVLALAAEYAQDYPA